MTSTTAHVPTTNGSRYLQQLCKHWGHKFEVDFTPERGVVKLHAGVVTMVAHPEALDVTISDAAEDDLPRLKDVVVKHIDRFAFREAPLAYDWNDAA
jgi:Uncharacterized protein conserved in bacteria